MCMEDVRIGRNMNGVVKAVAVGDGVAVQIANADPKRARLVVSTASGSLACLGDRSMDLATYKGFTFGQSPQTMVMTVEEWGVWLTGAIFAAGVGAATTVLVLDLPLETQ